MLEPNPTFGSAIFSSIYPPYPHAHKLRQNPAILVMGKEYSTDDNSSMDKSVDFSSDAKDEEERDESDSEQSYV